MKITHFHRKPSPSFHSIENVFNNFSKHISLFEIIKHYAPFQSTGFINRLKIGLDAKKNQSEINHISGHIHFIAFFLKKKKTILTIHDIGIIENGGWLKRTILKLFWFTLPLKFVKHVTVISEFTKQKLLQKFSIPENKITVINNCVSDNYMFKERNFRNKKPVILQIGTKTNKNLTRVIEAIKDTDCQLYIIGKLSLSQKEKLNFNNIAYQNFFDITEEELIQKYSESDLLLFASTYEGFGLPIVEANALGLPVITSNLEPMKSVANNAAFFIDPYDSADIKNGVLKVLKDENLKNKLIKMGIENAKKYKANNVAKQYCKLYQDLLDNKLP